jgi:hypothetical protein
MLVTRAGYIFIALALPGAVLLLRHYFTGATWELVAGWILVAPLCAMIIVFWCIGASGRGRA